MTCRLKLHASVLLAIFCLLAVALAQDASPAKPAPGQSDGVLGPQLIAWSELQKPQPVPQKPEPLPPPDTQPQPSQPPQSQTPPDQGGQKTQSESEAQQPAMQSIQGTVVKVAGKYVLETEDNVAYKLDDQDRAKEFDGKHVKVTGTLDRASGILHVKSIELLP